MSYAHHKLLLDAILLHLHRTPCSSLGDLSQELRVSRRTLERAIDVAAGRTFRNLREEILVERVRSLLTSHPARAIKELSFDLGYKSSRSFARAIKRACGSSPEKLRSSVICDLVTAENTGVSLEHQPMRRL